MTPEEQTKPTPATTSGTGDNLAAGAAPAADADLNKAAADLAGIAGENLASSAENDSPGSPAESSAPAAAAKPVTHAHLDGDSQELKPAPAPIEPAAPLPGSIGSVESGSSVAADAAVPADTAQAGAAMMATDVPVPGKATPAAPASVAEPTPGDPAVGFGRTSSHPRNYSWSHHRSCTSSHSRNYSWSRHRSRPWSCSRNY